MQFSDIFLPQKLITAYQKIKILQPTPIQSLSIPPGLNHQNLIAQAKSGTGKTIAFLSISLSQLLNHQKSEKQEKQDIQEKQEKQQKAEKQEKQEKPEESEQSEQQEKCQKQEQYEKQEQQEKKAKQENYDKQEKYEKSEKQQKQENYPRILILTPTRELALQIFQVINLIIGQLEDRIKSAVFVGGLPIQQLSRGLDIENIDLILNFDPSACPSTYLHRIGRTGRNHKTGLAISLSDPQSHQPFLSEIQQFPINDQEFIGNVNEQLREQQRKISIQEKKGFYYGGDSLVQEWQEVGAEEEGMWKGWDEGLGYGHGNKKGNKNGNQNGHGYQNRNGNEHGHGHGHGYGNEERNGVEDDWEFLKCRDCYQFLVRSEEFLGRKFKILQYFQIQDNEQQ